MDGARAIDALYELGWRMDQGTYPSGKLTLRRLLDSISPRKSYIVATRDHWLAVVDGENRDPAGTGMRSLVSAYWEVERIMNTED